MDNRSEGSSNGLQKLSSDIKNLADEIQKDINDQGKDLCNLFCIN